MDIVSQLRENYDWKVGSSWFTHQYEQNRIRAEAASEIEQNRIDLENYSRDAERLRAALNALITACDNGRWVELDAGGMTVGTYINRVPAYAVEEARRALEDVA